MANLTCITCNVSFSIPDLQRDHYRSEWHRYNLKRKVIELPPIKEEDFLKKLADQEAKAKLEEIVEPKNFCEVCHKSFGNSKAFTNHVQSKKHKLNVLSEEKRSRNRKIRVKPTANIGEVDENVTIHSPGPILVQGDDDEADWEDVDSDDESNALTTSQCLFCPISGSSMEENIKHMTIAHSFFIPDSDYLTDMEGLLFYLGAKVGDGNLCLNCNERGKSFYSIEAVQKHMVDKGHCRIDFEGDSILEYSDFYDFSSSYPEQNGEESEAIDENFEVDPETLELVLPSGTRLGHRSLQYIYRQGVIAEHLRQAPSKNHTRALKAFQAGGSLALHNNVIIPAERRRQMLRVTKWRHQNLRLCVKANKLQPHLRPQVIF